jgi:hypothetical protein
MYPHVLQMQVHIPGMHMVPFNDTNSLEKVVARAQSHRSMLTEYFKMNIEDPKAHQYLYREFSEHYKWVKSGKYWKPRKQHLQIGRLVYANPAEGCRYYLRILLNHVRGATLYELLRTHLSCLELQHKHDLDSLDRLSLALSCYLFSRLD